MIDLRKAVGLAALLTIAVLIARDAFVRSNIESRPDWATKAWPEHPDALIADHMVRIGKAAASHADVDTSLTAPIIEAIRRSPLSLEPFLVEGIKRQGAGQEALAGRLFLEAEQRDPRNVAPHYFLADHYAKSGQAGLGLTELGKIIRLVPGSAEKLAPRIATAAQQAGGAAMIRPLLAENPELRDDLMRAMSTDARNLDFVVSLRTVNSSNDWQPVMVQSLIAAGLYERAFGLWRQANGVRAAASRSLVIDPSFRLTAPPPFGWTLASGAAGIAESSDSGLHVVTYGRDPFVVASQTSLLTRGDYLLAQRIISANGNTDGLKWQVSCLGPDRTLASFAVGRDANVSALGKFAIPAGCAAQRIELLSNSVDVPETADFMFGPLELRRAQ